MITAVDTNILFDIILPDEPNGDVAEAALSEALSGGAVVISDPVYAEVSSRFPDRKDLDRVIEDTGMRRDPSNEDSLHRAGSVCDVRPASPERLHVPALRFCADANLPSMLS